MFSWSSCQSYQEIIGSHTNHRSRFRTESISLNSSNKGSEKVETVLESVISRNLSRDFSKSITSRVWVKCERCGMVPSYSRCKATTRYQQNQHKKHRRKPFPPQLFVWRDFHKLNLNCSILSKTIYQLEKLMKRLLNRLPRHGTRKFT